MLTNETLEILQKLIFCHFRDFPLLLHFKLFLLHISINYRTILFNFQNGIIKKEKKINTYAERVT